MARSLGYHIYMLYRPYYKLVDFIFSYLYLIIQPIVLFSKSFLETGDVPHHKFGSVKIPKFYAYDGLDRLLNFKAKETDVLIGSYPRSGTHWLAYIVSLIVHGDKLTADKKLYDFVKLVGGFVFPNEEVEAMDDPRIFFEHLPYHIYVSFKNIMK